MNTYERIAEMQAQEVARLTRKIEAVRAMLTDESYWMYDYDTERSAVVALLDAD